MAGLPKEESKYVLIEGEFTVENASKIAGWACDPKGNHEEAKQVYKSFYGLISAFNPLIKNEADFIQSYDLTLRENGTHGKGGLRDYFESFFKACISTMPQESILKIEPINGRLAGIIKKSHGIRFEAIVSAPSFFDKLCCRTPTVFFEAVKVLEDGKGARVTDTSEAISGCSTPDSPHLPLLAGYVRESELELPPYPPTGEVKAYEPPSP